tara:strand:+ start:135 stop:665 length:531 start_codon:yes stop_codon:yes gene_type:complete
MSKSLTAAEISAGIDILADEIYAAHPAGEFVLVGIRSRGDEVAERILERLTEKGMEIPMGVLDISLYRDDLAHLKSNPKLQGSELPFSIDGAHIVLVDDVLFTGRTIRAAIDALTDYGRCAMVELAVLIERGHRELPFAPTFIGHTLITSRHDYVNVKLRATDGEDSVVVTENNQS